jgi:glucuronate isomerase
MSARNLIINSNVKALCTTDDPADTLEWHRKLAEEGFEVKAVNSGEFLDIIADNLIKSL